jgi:hypothetical protein
MDIIELTLGNLKQLVSNLKYKKYILYRFYSSSENHLFPKESYA